MKKFALQGLNRAINTYLKLDPDTLQKLAALSDKVIKLEISDWHTHFFIYPHAHGVALALDSEAAPDTIISGKSFDLFKLGCARGQNSAIFQYQIVINGDTELGESIRDIFTQMDIDWKEHLSHIVGDIAAHQVGSSVRKTLQIGDQAIQTIKLNLKEYIQHEARYTPSKNEIEQFLSDVTNLAQAVERTEARIQRLIKHKDEQS